MQTKTATVKEKVTPSVSFTSGSIVKSMLTFAGPYMLGVIVQNLYGSVDLFVVGHFATTADVSAVTVGSQLMTMITQLIIGLATGVTVLIGQYFGAQDKKALSKTAGTSLIIFSIFAVILTAIFLIFHQNMVTAMQTPAEAIHTTRQYLFTCSLGIVFIVGYNVLSSILMGKGDTKTPFIFIVIACIINIVLDVILVKYVHLGALGAAIATTAAQAGSVIFSVIYLKKKGLGFPFSLKDIKFDGSTALKVAKIGGPVGVQNALVSVSFLFITAIINQIGLVASASAGVVEKLITFLMIPAISFGASVAAVSAQNVGAREYERSRKSMWCGVILSLIPSIIVVLFCQFKGELLTGLFTTNADVVYMAETYLRSYIWDCILVSFVFSMNGYFNSLNKSWFTMVHSLVTTFTLRIPLSLLFSRMGSDTLYIIGWAAPISTVVSTLMCFAFYIYLRRKDKVLMQN